MCTITVFRGSETLLVTMNRDEKRERAAEMAPRLHLPMSGGTRWLGPVDGQAGGSWIGVNAAGVVGCLMNRYPRQRESGARKGGPRMIHQSRGSVLRELLPQGTAAEIRSYLHSEFNPEVYPAFSLLLASLEGCQVYHWDGCGDPERQELGKGWNCLSSSSWNAEEVLTWRHGLFEQWLRAGAPFEGRLPEYHVHRMRTFEPWSPFMERADATTRSITQVRIEEDAPFAHLSYWGDPHVEPETPTHHGLPINEALMMAG